MKATIDYILPVALAVLLPGLNLFSNADALEDYSLSFYKRWAIASLVLYLLWHLIEWASRQRVWYRNYLTAFSVFVFTGVIYVLFSLMIFKATDHVKWVFIGKFLSASALFLIIQYALRTGKDLVQLRLEKERVQTEHYRVQLQELRLKVDPHFLFNSMNTLRTMIRNKDIQAENFVLNLSEFYRQTLRLNDAPAGIVQDELEVLKAYLFLMEKRNEGKVKWNIIINEDWYPYQIPTLALQIVVENCFKHNQASVSKPLVISIHACNGYYIGVKNNLQPKITKVEVSGYGLDNIRQRYDLLGIKNGLIINQTTTSFEVKLKLI